MKEGLHTLPSRLRLHMYRFFTSYGTALNDSPRCQRTFRRLTAKTHAPATRNIASVPGSGTGEML